MADHERDGLRGGPLRGHDQIAFVLAVLIVDDDDHAPGLQLGDDLFNGVQTGAGSGGAFPAQRNYVCHGGARGCKRMECA